MSLLFSIEHIMNLIPKESPSKIGFTDSKKNKDYENFRISECLNLEEFTDDGFEKHHL